MENAEPNAEIVQTRYTSLSQWFQRFAPAAKSMFLILQVFRLVCLILFTIFVFDCLLEKQQSTVDCQNFTMYRDPYTWKTTWLSCSVLTTLIMLFAFCQRFVPEIRPINYRSIIKILLKKPYFWSHIFLLVCVVVYDIVIIHQNTLARKHIEILVILSKIFTMILVFQLNFTFPPTEEKNFTRLTIYCYRVALVLYFLDNTVKAVTSTAQVAHKVYDTVDKDSHDGVHPMEIADLMLMTASAALYNYFLQFFWIKIWRGSKDILSVFRTDIVTETSRGEVRVLDHLAPPVPPDSSVEEPLLLAHSGAEVVQSSQPSSSNIEESIF